MQLEVMEHYTIEVSGLKLAVLSWQDMCPSAVWYPSGRDYADLVSESTGIHEISKWPLLREDSI